MNTHECVKCRTSYQSSDPDAYLCYSCQAAKKAIAAQIDAQFVGRVHVTVKSDLQAFEESGQSLNVDGRIVTINKA